MSSSRGRMSAGSSSSSRMADDEFEGESRLDVLGKTATKSNEPLTTTVIASRWKNKANINISDSDVSRDYQALVQSAKTKASTLSSSAGNGTSPLSPAEAAVKGGLAPQALAMLTAEDYTSPFGKIDDFSALEMPTKLQKKVRASLAAKTVEDHTQVPWESMRLQERLEQALVAAAESSGFDASEKDVARVINQSVQYATELRDSMPFFGLPTGDNGMRPFDFTGSTSSPSLMTAYKGPNQLLTSWFILELITETNWYMKLALPLRRSDNLAGEEYEQIIFNPTMFDRVPLLGTSSFATSRTATRRIMQVRYGKSAEMEFSFSRTERGRTFWSLQHVQIRNSLMSTFGFGIISAMMGCKVSSNKNFDNSGRGPNYRGGDPRAPVAKSRAEYETLLKKDHQAFDRVNKVADPLDRIVEIGMKRINEQSNIFSGGDNVNITVEQLAVSFPQGATRTVRQSNLHNDPRTTGRPRQEKFEERVDGVRVAPAGYKQVESRSFHTHDGEPIDPQFSTQTIGYFAWIPGGADWADLTFSAGSTAVLGGGSSANNAGGAPAAAAQAAAGAVARSAGALVPTLSQLTGAIAYRTEACYMDVWKADDDNWRTYSYAEIVHANQMYVTPKDASGRGGRGNGPKPPRAITAVGLAMVMNDANTNDWYLKAGETINDKRMLEHHKACAQRYNDAGKKLQDISNLTTADVMTVAEFWGDHLTTKMADHIAAAASAANAANPAAAANAPLFNRTALGILLRNPPAGGNPAATINTPAGAKLWLQHVSLIDSRFIDMCLDFNIPLFMQHLIVVPFSQFRAGASIVWRASTAELNGIAATGGSIGETLYGNPQYRIAFNANPGHYVAQFNIWFKPYVRNAQYVYIDVASFVECAIRGDNGEFFTSDDAVAPTGSGAYFDAVRSWDDRPEAMHTAYSIALPPQAALFKSKHFDITGAYAKTACVEKSGTAHYPTAEFYKRYWAFRPVDSVDKQDATFSSARGNSIVSRNAQQRRDEATGRLQKWRCEGHLGKNLEPGSFTSRGDTLLPQQTQQIDSTVAIM